MQAVGAPKPQSFKRQQVPLRHPVESSTADCPKTPDLGVAERHFGDRDSSQRAAGIRYSPSGWMIVCGSPETARRVQFAKRSNSSTT
jgi:hypothetical protein